MRPTAVFNCLKIWRFVYIYISSLPFFSWYVSHYPSADYIIIIIGMKTDNKEMNVYVQPDFKVYQVKMQQMIAASPSVETQELEEEIYYW